MGNGSSNHVDGSQSCTLVAKGGGSIDLGQPPVCRRMPLLAVTTAAAAHITALGA